jgi:hypothetical protein
MRHEFTTLAAAVVLGCAGVSAMAGVLLTSQTRTVSAMAGDAAGTQSDAKAASGYGFYDDFIEFSYTGTEFGGGGTGYALQTSNVQSDHIGGEGTGTGSGGGGVGTGFAGGTSYLSVTFTVTTPIQYSLEGFISADVGFNHASVILSGPSGEIIHEEVGGYVGYFGGVLFTGPEGYGGTLGAGDYTITAEASANDDSFASPMAIFDFALTLTEMIGDFNGDALVDAGDIDQLTAAIRAGSSDPDFDLDGSGVVDAGDLDAMVGSILLTFAGDANLDRSVNLIDLSALASGFGGPGGWANGNFNTDSLVDLIDLSLLASNFGITAVVPEPAVTGLTLAGLSCIRRRYRAYALRWRPQSCRPAVRALAACVVA